MVRPTKWRVYLLALVAEIADEKGVNHIAASARLSRSHSDDAAEVAFVAADKRQNQVRQTQISSHQLK